ncbi:hypothetical protein BX661DRAFT_172326 [Kickxella alabastrina]|uniref:uncharacterized protein n=1 Tax=Kickxella alabastrina TaxID=61397 RepID=UPI0022206769|nr:uncharacterized protein BX661DRAFT_172326 [Kickxella alabastrina]KAI7824505.1 hypothetical protein BX661DRAFT_172326 [Kickxella alabastrina]
MIVYREAKEELPTRGPKASEPSNVIEAEEFETNEQAENEFEGYDTAYRYDHNTVNILDDCHFDPELAGNFDCDEHANQQTNEQPTGGCASDTCSAPTTALSDFTMLARTPCSSGITVAKVVTEARRQVNHMVMEFMDNPGFNIPASKVVTDLCEQFISHVNKRHAAIALPSGALPVGGTNVPSLTPTCAVNCNDTGASSFKSPPALQML